MVGRPDVKNKVAFSNFSSAVWTGPETVFFWGQTFLIDCCFVLFWCSFPFTLLEKQMFLTAIKLSERPLINFKLRIFFRNLFSGLNM